MLPAAWPPAFARGRPLDEARAAAAAAAICAQVSWREGK